MTDINTTKELDKKYIMVDPPSGWLYGFPKKMPADKDVAEFFRENGYPEKDIDFACKYYRVWDAE